MTRSREMIYWQIYDKINHIFSLAVIISFTRNILMLFLLFWQNIWFESWWRFCLWIIRPRPSTTDPYYLPTHGPDVMMIDLAHVKYPIIYYLISFYSFHVLFGPLTSATLGSGHMSGSWLARLGRPYDLTPPQAPASKHHVTNGASVQRRSIYRL